MVVAHLAHVARARPRSRSTWRASGGTRSARSDGRAVGRATRPGRWCPTTRKSDRCPTGVRPDVVLAVERHERPDDAEVLVADRDAARVVVVARCRRGCASSRRRTPSLRSACPLGPAARLCDDAEEHRLALAPLVGLALHHDRVVLARAGRRRGLVVELGVLRASARRARRRGSATQERARGRSDATRSSAS